MEKNRSVQRHPASAGKPGFINGGDHWVTAYKYQGHRTVTLADVHFWICGTNPCP